MDNPNPLLFLDADLRRAMASSLVEALHRDSPRSTQRRLSVADAETALTAYAEQIKRLAYDERSVRVRLTLHGGAVPNKYRYPAKADWILASVRLEAGNPTSYTLRATRGRARSQSFGGGARFSVRVIVHEPNLRLRWTTRDAALRNAEKITFAAETGANVTVETIGARYLVRVDHPVNSRTGRACTWYGVGGREAGWRPRPSTQRPI